MLMLYLVLFVIGLACGLLGAYVGFQKGRAPIEGLVIGAMLGPLGVLVVALLPTVDVPTASYGPAVLHDDDIDGPFFLLTFDATRGRDGRPVRLGIVTDSGLIEGRRSVRRPHDDSDDEILRSLRELEDGRWQA